MSQIGKTGAPTPVQSTNVGDNAYGQLNKLLEGLGKMPPNERGNLLKSNTEAVKALIEAGKTAFSLDVSDFLKRGLQVTNINQTPGVSSEDVNKASGEAMKHIDALLQKLPTQYRA